MSVPCVLVCEAGMAVTCSSGKAGVGPGSDDPRGCWGGGGDRHSQPARAAEGESARENFAEEPGVGERGGGAEPSVPLGLARMRRAADGGVGAGVCAELGVLLRG